MNTEECNMIEVRSDRKHDYIGNFQLFEHVIAIRSVLNDHSKGKLFVDCIESPQLFIIWNEFDGFYVSASQSVNEEAIKKSLQFLMEHCKIDDKEFVIYIDHRFEDSMGEILATDVYEKMKVLTYTNDKATKQEVNPMGFEVINTQEIELSAIYEHHDLIESINYTWPNVGKFETEGFGILLYDKEDIIGYCISEHVTKEAIEFNLEIKDEYKGIGYTKAMGNAMINLCVENKKQPYIYCTDDDDSMIKLAEDIGLTKKKAFDIWYFEI